MQTDDDTGVTAATAMTTAAPLAAATAATLKQPTASRQPPLTDWASKAAGVLAPASRDTSTDGGMISAVRGHEQGEEEEEGKQLQQQQQQQQLRRVSWARCPSEKKKKNDGGGGGDPGFSSPLLPRSAALAGRVPTPARSSLGSADANEDEGA